MITSTDVDQPSRLEETLQLTADIVAAYLSNNNVNADAVPELIRSIHVTLNGLGRDGNSAETSHKPAVPLKKSISNEYIICLEDGKKLKMLKRYLRTHYNMSPEEYRAKWGLPADYPMVAPAYAAQRSDFAKQIGLGRGGRPRTQKKVARRR